MSAPLALLAALQPLPGLADAVLLQPAAVAQPPVSEVRPGAAIERALTQRQTGVFVMFRAALAQDGEVEARAVLVDGQLVEALAQRRGLPLRRIAATLPVQAGAAVAAQLLRMPADQPLTDPAQRRAFVTLLGWHGAALMDQASGRPRLIAAAQPVQGLVFFQAQGRPALARWAFEYQPQRSFGFSNGAQRVVWSLGG